jgi:hypothetical protein
MVRSGDHYYQVIREIPVKEVSKKTGEIIPELFNAWKEHLGANHVLKDQGIFLFCKTIPEADWQPIS